MVLPVPRIDPLQVPPVRFSTRLSTLLSFLLTSGAKFALPTVPPERLIVAVPTWMSPLLPPSMIRSALIRPPEMFATEFVTVPV